MMNQKGRSDLPECRADATFLFDDVYKNSTRGEKKQTDARQYGRSMVEMLGVLAIIGVLSVGGITGYNKAIYKHRLNVHTQGINFLLMNVLDLKVKLNRSTDNSTTHYYYPKILRQLNLIPNGFSYIDDWKMKDNMGNDLWIYDVHEHETYFGEIGFHFSANSPDGAALCQNILSVAKEYSSDLLRIQTGKFSDDPKSTIYESIYGDKYCKNKNACISDITLEDRRHLCNTCDAKSCSIYLLWD